MIGKTKDFEARQLIDQIVFWYAERNDEKECYELNFENIPEKEKYEILSVYLCDPSHASEAIGPDNPFFDKIMMPSFIKYLQNVVDKDFEIEYLQAWREGCLKYFKKRIQDVIDEKCENLYLDAKAEAGFYLKIDREHGDSYWSRR